MTRTRTKGSLSNGWYRIVDHNPDGSVSSDSTTTTAHKYDGELKSITDVSTPDFDKKSSLGSVVMSPMNLSFTRRTTILSDLNLRFHFQWGSRVISGPLACVWSDPITRPGWFATRIADAQARTLVAAHSKVAAPNFMGQVSVVEAKKTASMIARPLASSRLIMSKMWGAKVRSGKAGLNMLESAKRAYLEYRFGLRPLLYDLGGMRDAWLDRNENHLRPVRLVARSTDNLISWEGHDLVSGPRPGTTMVSMRRDYYHSAKVSSGVLYELTDENEHAGMLRRTGLRWADIPSSLWELLPYSFVLDRFIDIGMWLNAVIPKPGVRILGSWTSVVDRQVNNHEIVDAYVDVGTPLVRLSAKGGTYIEEIHNVSRLANPVLPLLPTINYRDLTLAQHIDHLALLIADFRRLRH